MAAQTRNWRTPAVALLLLGSGASALVYQVAWIRSLRLVFGASTGASGAVLAIFMGGLGLGGLLLGRRADRSRNPLRTYAFLELGISVLAVASPLLIELVRSLYLASGGSASLGPVPATLARIGLSTLALGPATVLMGGTLPMAVSSVEDADDAARRRTGLLYGLNTVGAVLGAVWANFIAIELLGIKATLWSAAAVNALIGLAALRLSARPSSRRERTTAKAGTTPLDALATGARLPQPFLLVTAGVSGFVFLLMELVWYRMLGPILGGSSYTFGLILAVVLLGIGAGSLLYSFGAARRRPTPGALAVAAGAEALAIAAPYALGDRIAVFALALQPLGDLGFLPQVAVWTSVTLLVVFPAAVVSGYLFPLLLGLVGAGERAIGRHIGLVYAANTLGAILGSLFGAFGLLPLLGAPAAWVAAACSFAALAVAALLMQGNRSQAPARKLAPFVIVISSLLLCRAEGPTAFWRHAPIGVARVHPPKSSRQLRHMVNDLRRTIQWEADGIEGSVALQGLNGYSFVVNGKSDGNAIEDAPTQVMIGVVPAFLHPRPKHALVIGLGTGSTAGWLASAPSIERVDVVELEPAILRVATACAAVNRQALSNPKVKVIIGDGREFLLTTREKYDIIVSEPSNPYRAGVASLFSREFYEAAAARLMPDGIFAQWLQAYDIQADTVRTVYATLGSVFPAIETWEVALGGDLLLTAQSTPPEHDVARTRARAAEEPYRSALAAVWGVSGAEGLYSGLVGGPALAEAVARSARGRVNTDDRPFIEFEFARSPGRADLFRIEELRALADADPKFAPQTTGGSIDWQRVAEMRSIRALAEGVNSAGTRQHSDAAAQRILARQAYHRGEMEEAYRYWSSQPEGPQAPVDEIMLAELLVQQRDPAALEWIERLRDWAPLDASALLAAWHHQAGHPEVAAAHLGQFLADYRTHPWAYDRLMRRTLDLIWTVASESHALAMPMFDALEEPFAAGAFDDRRVFVRLSIALREGFEDRCAAALATVEPDVLWERPFLEKRLECYRRTSDPLAARAEDDLRTYDTQAPKGIAEGIQISTPPPDGAAQS